MKKFWAQLKPQERRWVTGIGVAIFIILNYFMVWPRFAEWGRNNARMKRANDNMAMYQKEIAHKPEYERKIGSYLAAGDEVQLEDQGSRFANSLQDRALENGVGIQHTGGVISRTNDEFFVEQEMNIQVQSGEKNLVNFLYSLGSSNSMMRVRSMSLHPIEPTRYQLDANLKIVASFQRKNPGRPPTTAPAAAPAKAPAAAPTQPAQPAARPGARSNTPPAVVPKTTPTITTNKPGPSKPK